MRVCKLPARTWTETAVLHRMRTASDCADPCLDKITWHNHVKCYDLMEYPVSRDLNCNDMFYGQSGISFSK